MKRLLGRILIASAAMMIFSCLFACDRPDKKSVGAPEEVTVANIIPPFTVLVDVAEQQGYHKQEGLAVTMQKYPYGQVALRAMLEGKADFATVAETPIMLAIMNGEKISIIATIQTSHKNNAIIARKDKGINTPRDLKGRRIAATFGTIGEFFMDTFLVVHGISKSDMKVVDLKPQAMHTALANGDVDAVSTWTPPLLDMQMNLGDGGITFYSEDIFTQTVSVVAKQDFIHANPGKVRKLLRALLRAEEFIRGNPAEAQKNVAEFNHTDVEMLRKMWDDNTYSVSLDQSLILALEDESQWAIKNRLTKATKVPNYLNFIYLDGLQSIKPKAVRILK